MATGATDASSRWLFGPATDLLLGCGGAYLIVFGTLMFAGSSVMAFAPIGLLPIAILLTSVPHYGGTLLRVYERGEDRSSYRLFGLWATLIIYAVFVTGVYDVFVGSVLVTIYLIWSPWHYSGQNYGIALMLLGRRGVSVTPLAKRFFYLSFVLSYFIAILGLYSSDGAVYAPVSAEETAYRVLRFAVPVSIALPLMGALALGYLGCVGSFVALVRREAGWRELFPALCLTGLQALWFALPAISRQTGLFRDQLPFDPRAAEYTFLWIAMGHSVQYIWITTYYALNSQRASKPASYYGRCLLAGGAIWGLPLFLFGPDLLGVRAVDAGLGLLVASAVNIHHFVLDGAIWKLRDGRIARILLRAKSAATDVARSASTGNGGARAVFAIVAVIGLLYAVATVFGTFEMEFGVRRSISPPDAARLETAAERLRWIGRANPDVHYNLGVLARQQGDLAAARREFMRSLELGETAPAWLGLGLVEHSAGRYEPALRAYDAVLAIDPQSVPALVQSATLLAQRGDRAAARARLERALTLAPRRADLRERLDAL
jgi:tetratricopeptide (TPR) repeat protein